jgi:2,4-dienoyl-CoA reductase-like NADH-dependent reductase (Old Yellow Enzyme family)
LNPRLFSSLTLRSVSLPNRIVISPMSTYSSENGFANDWHLVNYGKFAQSGAGMVMVETAAVSPDGRGTYGDLGLWSDDHVAPLTRVAAFIRSQGSVPALQIGHSGRKGSMQRPWEGYGIVTDAESARGEPAWQTVAPSAIAAADGWPEPMEMSRRELEEVALAWEAAARRAVRAGFDVLEVHCAHGYLLHEFLSPVANQRTDEYGGDAARRMAYPLEIVKRVRAVWPAEKPLMCRVSSVDGAEGGYDIEDTVAFARELKALGVDVVDCSSGGISGFATVSNRLPRTYGHQVPYAARVRAGAGISTMAVGLIINAQQAEEVLEGEQADLIGVGREALYNPNWAFHARHELGQETYDGWPAPYGWWLAKRARLIKSMDEACVPRPVGHQHVY